MRTEPSVVCWQRQPVSGKLNIPASGLVFLAGFRGHLRHNHGEVLQRLKPVGESAIFAYHEKHAFPNRNALTLLRETGRIALLNYYPNRSQFQFRLFWQNIQDTIGQFRGNIALFI